MTSVWSVGYPSIFNGSLGVHSRGYYYYSHTLLGVGMAAWPGADLGEPGLVMPRQPGVDDGGGSQPQSRWLVHTETWAGSRA